MTSQLFLYQQLISKFNRLGCKFFRYSGKRLSDAERIIRVGKCGDGLHILKKDGGTMTNKAGGYWQMALTLLSDTLAKHVVAVVDGLPGGGAGEGVQGGEMPSCRIEAIEFCIMFYSYSIL